MKNLSPKQERFCLLYLESGNASQAYRGAGYSKNMSDKTVNEASARLLKSSKVVARLAEIRKPALEAAQITLADHLKDLKRLRDLSESEGKFSAAVSAEIARGKVSGLYIEKVEITGELSLAEAITKAKARVQ
jgi:phage terminase small subunit